MLDGPINPIMKESYCSKNTLAQIWFYAYETNQFFVYFLCIVINILCVACFQFISKFTNEIYLFL